MLTIFLLLLPLFSIIGVGFIAGRTKIADKQWIKVLNLYGFYIAFPALIFQSIAATSISLSTHGKIIIVHTIFALVLMGATWFITKALGFSKELRNTFTIGIYFANAGYVGLPALELVFGEQALSEGAVIVAVMILITFTLGVGILESSRNSKVNWNKMFTDIAKNPLLWSAILGVLISFVQISLPETITTIIKMLAASASPAVLIALGVFLATNKPKRSTLQLAGILSSLKMLVIPVVFAGLLWLIPDGDAFDVTYIQSVMPLAITNFAFAEIYPMDKGVISSSIVITTLSAIVLLPLFMWLTTII